jgi:hypothetical protein
MKTGCKMRVESLRCIFIGGAAPRSAARSRAGLSGQNQSFARGAGTPPQRGKRAALLSRQAKFHLSLAIRLTRRVMRSGGVPEIRRRIKLPQRIRGERVRALVVTSPDASDPLTAESIEAACRERLAGLKNAPHNRDPD